jgi:alanine dehydrogenase
MIDSFKIGLPRMHKEPGERRGFLPSFVSQMAQLGASIILEYGYGSEMRFTEEDYLKLAPEVTFASQEETYQQDYVMVLRYPGADALRRMHRGACLISMLHYPTRPKRVALLRSLGLEAISLDSVKDDNGRRLVENLRAVGWNGIEVAFEVLRSTYPAPGFGSAERGPIQVTLMGAGAVGTHVVHAAIRYGNDETRQHMAKDGIPGVLVNVIDYDITPHEEIMKTLLSHTDVLVDATQRPDPSKPVIPNSWVAYLPEHAVLLDLSVDPYNCQADPPYIKGIEGIPQGDLDKYIFTPDDPEFDLLPECIETAQRRHSVSCYSWPGIHPRECMKLYGHQIRPLIRKLIEAGGVDHIDPKGRYFERAMARAMLSRWENEL